MFASTNQIQVTPYTSASSLVFSISHPLLCLPLGGDRQDRGLGEEEEGKGRQGKERGKDGRLRKLIGRVGAATRGFTHVVFKGCFSDPADPVSYHVCDATSGT